MVPPSQAPRIYLSSSREDEGRAQEFARALEPWRAASGATVWHRFMTEPGEDVLVRVAAETAQARVALSLLSSDYFSDSMAAREANGLMSRHILGELQLVPIILRPVDWKSTPFRSLPVLPRDHGPITAQANIDAAWLSVVEGLKGIVGALLPLSTASEAVPSSRISFEEMALRLSRERTTERFSEIADPPQSASNPVFWEEWLFDQCAARNRGGLLRLAEMATDPEVARSLRGICEALAANRWPVEVAETYVHVQPSPGAYRVTVRVGFLGLTCSMVVQGAETKPLGGGALLHVETKPDASTLSISAELGSPLIGSRALVRQGLRAVRRWLVPLGTDGLGPEHDQSTILEIDLQTGEIT